jgi:hypothetical protein
MDLIERVPVARQALELARMEEANRIAEVVQANRVVGVLGEADTGKSETIRQALGGFTAKVKVLGLDLDGAAGDDHVGFLLAKAIARAQLGDVDFSLLSAGVLVPSKVESRRVKMAELLGVEGLEEALRRWPSGGYSARQGLGSLGRLLAQGTPVVLWVDHLEAPLLTPRHPLQLDPLLWGVRELVQREPGLSVVLSGRAAVESEVLGPSAAFHQQGQWIPLDNPRGEAWRRVAEGLRVSVGVADEMTDMTAGHPVTMLLGLLELAESDAVLHAHEVLRRVAARDAGLVARAMQHARSLHRLGGQVMIQVANGEPPYGAAQRGRSPTQEITKVLGRLRLAGMLRHDDGWSVLNPLVAYGLRGSVERLTAPGLATAEASDAD